MDSMRSKAQKMMPHIMALNKNPTMGMKNNRQPMPGVSNLTAYAKGGKVMAKGGAADKKQDKSMLSRHNKLMHPGQKSKLMSGGMVKGYEKGGGIVTRGDKANIRARNAGYAKKAAEMLEEANKPLSKVKSFLTDNVEKMKEAVKSVGRPDYRDSPLKKTVQSAANLGKGTLKLGKLVTPVGAFLTTMSPSSLNEGEDDRMRKINKDFSEKPESLKNYKGPSTDTKINMPKLPSINIAKKSRNKDEDKPRSDDYFIKRAQKRNKETAPSDDYKRSGYKKGGKVKGDKKKVMGTVGEAKALMNAMKKVRRPATPMPGARMAGLGMAPPMAPQMMAPPMKRGGKVMKKAAGGSKKRHTNSKGV
jgi:hypothetical protein